MSTPPPTPAASPTPLLALRGVGKVYGGGVPTRALEGVSFDLAPGEFAALVGASGSGKTTLLNLIGLLDTPTEGEISLDGHPLSSLDAAACAALRRDRIGFVFQFHHLLPEFTAWENALMPCRLRGRRAEEAAAARVADLFQRVGLGDRLHHRPSQLSGGQQQRVALVRALANQPALVLADEPTGNLDSHNADEVFELLRGLCRESGTTILFVSHDDSLARRAERRLHLADGRLVGESR